MELIPCALYEAQRMDNGKYITGALIHSPHSPFAYIATIKNMENNGGTRTHGCLSDIVL